MKISKVVSSLTAGLLLLSNPGISPAEAAEESAPMRDITTMELVKDMGIGINLEDARALSAALDRKVSDWSEITRIDCLL